MMEEKLNKRSRYMIGLMSGTSVDGIDAALVEVSGDPFDGKRKLIAFENRPFPEKVRADIFELFDCGKATVERVGYMNVLLGELYAQAAFSVVEKAGMTMKDISLIGSHGQTIYHHPEYENGDGFPIHYTVQIGEGAVIASRTGVPCVSDFRAADMAAGGQGAPLVPFTEYLLYRSDTETILLQNIGGIGNITVLPAGCRPEDVYAFDTGPGNMIIDGLIHAYTDGKQGMDIDGRIAGSGCVNIKLLEELCRNSYFDRKPPKSTGRELFGKKYIKKIYERAKAEQMPFEDVIATATEFTAWSIENSYQNFIKEKHSADKLIIGGGGSYNSTLVSMIKSHMERMEVKVMTQEELGYSSDAKEAVAFAVLADFTMAGKCNTIPQVTGADKSVILGKISLP